MTNDGYAILMGAKSFIERCHRLLFILVLAWLCGLIVTPPAKAESPPTAEQLFAPFNQAESICILRLEGMEETPSDGPARVWTRGAVVKILRGARPRFDIYRAAGPWVTVDQFQPDQEHIVAFTGDSEKKQMLVEGVLPATEKNLRWVKIAMSYPTGWILKDGRPVSPWPTVPDMHYVGEGQAAFPPCAVSGRPPFRLPPGVDLQVVPVLPPDRTRQKNPRGDGEFAVTLLNTTDSPLEVPALRQANHRILWEQSLVVLQDRAPHILLGADQPSTNAPAILPPKGNVRTTVNLLDIPTLSWPREPHPALPMPNDRTRMWFQICIGDRSVRTSFEFHPRHHGKLVKKRAGDAQGAVTSTQINLD